MERQRDIRYGNYFAADLAAIDEDVRRTDEALRYCSYMLSLDPRAGFPSRTAPGIWRVLLVFSVDGQTVPVDLAYEFDDQVVTFLAINRAPYQYDRIEPPSF